MGKVKEVLNVSYLNDNIQCAERLTIELCENIHMHYQDLRIEMDEKIFKVFVECMSESFIKFKKAKARHREGKFTCLNYKNIPSLNKFSNKFVVELLRNKTIHIHLRDFRIETDIKNFRTMAEGIIEAYNRLVLDKRVLKLGSRKKELYTEKEVLLEEINPYDTIHRKDSTSFYGYSCCSEYDTEEHEKGIRLCMELIKNGYKILPISILPIKLRDKIYSGPITKGQKYQRLDGFKRLEAWRRLGYKKIFAYIYNSKNARPGNQRYKYWIIS